MQFETEHPNFEKKFCSGTHQRPVGEKATHLAT
jgi:hypothetical protein